MDKGILLVHCIWYVAYKVSVNARSPVEERTAHASRKRSRSVRVLQSSHVLAPQTAHHILRPVAAGPLDGAAELELQLRQPWLGWEKGRLQDGGGE